MNNTEQKVLDRLKSYGFLVERVPEGTTKTCDFLAVKTDEEYFIEVKEKSETNKKGSHNIKSGYNSSIAKIFRRAKSQLTKGNEQRKRFSIIWIVLGEDDTDNDFLRDRIISTLYGVQRVELHRNGFSFETDYYRLFPGRLNWESKVDCVILEEGAGLTFCLNEEAESYPMFRKCQLFKLHKSPLGVVDPIIMSNEGRCILPTTKGSRVDKKRCFLKETGFESISEITTTMFVSYVHGSVKEGQ